MDDAPALEDSYLRNWFADTRSVTVESRTLFDELTTEQLLWKPGPKTWGVAECFAHLVTTADLYHPRIEQALGEVRSLGSGDHEPFAARWFQRWFIGSIGPQSRRRFKTFKAFDPSSSDLDAARVEEDFFGRQEELGDLIRRADGCDLNRGRVDSPITRLLHFTLGEALWLVTAHSQRHLLQAQRVRQAEGFPGR